MSDSSQPLHQPSVDALAASGLRMSLVDPADEAAYDPWHVALVRGFHGHSHDDDLRRRMRDAMAFRRTTGVYDDAAHDPRQPVGTVNSWRAALTVPGGRTVDGWAISSVTVAPTHRRRGIARALLEAELCTAAALGIPVAMLTVSESTIYGRFGFGAAAMAADWRIDTRRASWTGPVPDGRVDFITIDEWRSLVPALHDEARLGSPGEIPMWGGRWDQLSGDLTGDTGLRSKLRAAQYADADGAVRGVVLFRITEVEGDFSGHRLTVDAIVTTTPDAHAALWRFLLETDLVSSVEAALLSIDDPVRWMISDWRAATVTTYEHQYLRLLDVAAAFTGRGYSTSGSLALTVADPLGYTAGTWLLEVDGADAAVTSVSTIPPGVPALDLSVNELSSLYLGGVAVPTLVAAGRVHELTPGAAVAADALLHSPMVPWLSRWY